MNAQPYQDPIVLSLEAAASSLEVFTTSKEAQQGAKLASRLAAKLRKPIRVALGGEFSSGKSSLANMLVGKEVITTSVTASTLPTVIFEYSKTEKSRAIWPDGKVQEWDLVDVNPKETEGADRIYVGLNRPLLKQFEFLDTPGTGDPSRDEDQIEKMACLAHLVLWCSNGAQAWRETERYLWSELPKRLHESSILVLTHVDMPRVAKQLDRLLKRVNKDAQKYFQEIVPVATLKATEARNSDGEIMDKKEWENSGGEELIGALNSAAGEIRTAHRLAAKKILEERITPLVQKIQEENVASGDVVPAVEVAVMPPVQVLTQSWLSHLAALNADIRRSENVEPGDMITRCGQIVHNFYDTEVFPVRDDLSLENQKVFDEFTAAAGEIATLAGQRNKAMAVRSVMTILAQLGWDTSRVMHTSKQPKAAE